MDCDYSIRRTGLTSALGPQVLLLDEVTVDMDIVGRLDLLQFFKEECTERGATIVYATHIFDGLEDWATHLAYVANGKLQKGEGHLNPGFRKITVLQKALSLLLCIDGKSTRTDSQHQHASRACRKAVRM